VDNRIIGARKAPLKNLTTFDLIKKYWLCMRIVGSNFRNDYLLLPIMASDCSVIRPNVALSHITPASSNPEMAIELCQLKIRTEASL